MANFCEYRTLYDLVDEDKPYEEFYSKMRLQYEKEFRRTGDIVNQGQIRSLDTEMEFYRNRKPSFRVYSGMATALSMTDIDIPSGELHLPFSSFQIQLQPETFFFDPTVIAPLTETPLKGKPYLCSMLVCRRTLAPFAKSKELANANALELYLDIRDSGNPSTTIDSRVYVALLPEKTLKEGFEFMDVEQHFRIDRASQERMASLAVGVIFLAISRERKWVQRTRIKIKNADYCLCGSGKKYRKCCGPKTNTTSGDPIGFTVGRDIQLPYSSGSSTGVMVENRGDELQYSHIRSGHMRWQWKNDPEGKRIRELIFIAPTVVRPDLPLKPQLTPRRTKPHLDTPPNSRRNPDKEEIPEDAPVLACRHRGSTSKIFFLYLKKESAGILLCPKCILESPDSWIPSLEQTSYAGPIKQWANAAQRIDLGELPQQLSDKKKASILDNCISEWYLTNKIDEFQVCELFQKLSVCSLVTKIAGIDINELYKACRSKSDLFRALPAVMPILKTNQSISSLERDPGGLGNISVGAKQISITFYNYKTEWDNYKNTEHLIATTIHEMLHSALAWKGDPNYYQHERSFIQKLTQLYQDILGQHITAQPDEIQFLMNQTGGDFGQVTADVITTKAGMFIKDKKLIKKILAKGQRNPWAFAELPTDLRPVFYRNPSLEVCQCARRNPDEDLRALERRYQQTGAVTDKATYWRACLRIGTLPPVDLVGTDTETTSSNIRKWVLDQVGEVQVQCLQPAWLVGCDTVGIRFYHPKVASEFPVDVDVVEGTHSKLHDEIAKRLDLLIKEVGI